MLLSIFTPTFNREKTLPRLYNSIKTQKNKNCFEWIIVDDGSSDNTKSVVQGFIDENVITIRYFYKKNGGKHMQDEQSQKITEKEARRLEIEKNFSYDNFQVIRKELFAHLRDPAVTIRNDSITFNTACIGGLEDAVYVNVLINEVNKRIVVRRCEENDVDALRWCIAKPDGRKSRTVKGREFAKRLYEIMGWDPRLRYKVMGYKITFQDQTLYVFDLTQPEMFVQRPGKKGNAAADSKLLEEHNAAVLANPAIPKDDKILSGRQGFLPETTGSTFGMSVEEHEKSHEVTELDGLTSMEMLTGNMHRGIGGSDGQQ